MNLSALFIKLKGSRGSGNFGHGGRPGKHGGSSSGGGLATLGLDRSSNINERKSLAEANRKIKKAEILGSDALKKHYNLDENCIKTKVSCNSISDYTGPGYSAMNKQLRSGNITSKWIKEDVSSIDKAFEDLPRTPKTIKVKRNIISSSSSLVEQMVEGGEFQDKGFVSTTIKPQGLSSFGGTQIQIIVPKGSKGIYVEDISQNSNEQEFLLPRNAKFRVLRNNITNDRLTKSGESKIVIEYLGDE